MEEKKVMTHVTKGLLVSLILIVIGVIGHITDIELDRENSVRLLLEAAGTA